MVWPGRYLHYPFLCEYVMPFVRIGGYFIAMKGSNIEDEISGGRNAVSVLGGEIEEVKISGYLLKISREMLFLIKNVDIHRQSIQERAENLQNLR